VNFCAVEDVVKVFICGATGVIGRRAIPILLAAGHDVSALARSAEAVASLTAAGATPVRADLFDPATLHAAVADHEAVINLATHIPPLDLRVLLRGAWAENDRIRSVGAANLIDAAHTAGARIFIQESFAPVYPDCGDSWIDEDVPIAPVRYNLTVADAERAAARFGERGGTAIVLRFAAFYGPDADQFINLVGSLRRGWVPLPGRPDGFVSSVSHDDAASAVAAALNAPAGVYNIVDNEPLRRREFYNALAACIGVGPPKILPGRLAPLFGSLGRLLARSQRISNRKFRSAIGWQPKFSSVREGFPATVAQLHQG
jgi:2-alkyl-3-oxoalkanoate reductase